MALDHISQGHSNKVKWKDESVKSYRAEFELRPLTEVWWIPGKIHTPTWRSTGSLRFPPHKRGMIGPTLESYCENRAGRGDVHKHQECLSQ